MSFNDYQKLDTETNERIMNVVYKLYTLGCWMESMHRLPPAGICFEIKCCVKNVEQISEDDKLRYQMSAQYLKDIFPEQISYYITTNVEYVGYIIDKDSLINGIKMMLKY